MFVPTSIPDGSFSVCCPQDALSMLGFGIDHNPAQDAALLKLCFWKRRIRYSHENEGTLSSPQRLSLAAWDVTDFSFDVKQTPQVCKYHSHIQSLFAPKNTTSIYSCSRLASQCQNTHLQASRHQGNESECGRGTSARKRGGGRLLTRWPSAMPTPSGATKADS